MEYIVWFDVNCSFVETVEAENVKQAVEIARGNIDNDIDEGNLDVFETRLAYVQDDKGVEIDYED